MLYLHDSGWGHDQAWEGEGIGRVEGQLLQYLLHTFLAKDPSSSSSLVFLGQNIKARVRRTTRKNIPTTAFLRHEVKKIVIINQVTDLLSKPVLGSTQLNTVIVKDQNAI